MSKKILFLSLILSFGPINSFGAWKEVDAFTVLDTTAFKPDLDSEKTVKNMPKTESQDSLGVCFGFSSWAVAQQFYCQKKKIDCSNLKSNQKISPFQMAAFSTEGNSSMAIDFVERYDSIPSGGSGLSALVTAIEATQMGFADSCFPWDQFVNKYGDDPKIHQAIFDKLKKTYDKSKTEGSACEECLVKTLNDDLGMKIDGPSALKALNAKTYQNFLWDVFFRAKSSTESDPFCKDILSFGSGAKVEIYPPQKKVSNYDDIMPVVRNVIASGSPINLDGICMERNGKNCTAKHTVAITGYRKACRQTTACANKCNEKACFVESVKVQNSWGEGWQRDHAGGWVDAQSLFKESEPLSSGVISWIKPKAK